MGTLLSKTKEVLRKGVFIALPVCRVLQLFNFRNKLQHPWQTEPYNAEDRYFVIIFLDPISLFLIVVAAVLRATVLGWLVLAHTFTAMTSFHVTGFGACPWSAQPVSIKDCQHELGTLSAGEGTRSSPRVSSLRGMLIKGVYKECVDKCRERRISWANKRTVFRFPSVASTLL